MASFLLICVAWQPTSTVGLKTLQVEPDTTMYTTNNKDTETDTILAALNDASTDDLYADATASLRNPAWDVRLLPAASP